MEDSQLESAERLVKLTAIAARAACVIMQLVQARDGRSAQDAAIAFTPVEIKVHARARRPIWRATPRCRAILIPPQASLGRRLDHRPTRRMGRLPANQAQPRDQVKRGVEYALGVAQAWSMLNDV